MQPLKLRWQPRALEQVRLPPSEVLYRDGLALSEVMIAPSESVCCIRRQPYQAEVLTWPPGLSGAPESWTSGINLHILQAFGFDGKQVFAHTGEKLLRIQPGRVETLYESSGGIRAPSISSDSTTLLWIEGTTRGRLVVAPADRAGSPKRLPLEHDCSEAVWIAPDRILVKEVRKTRGAEESVALSVHPVKPGSPHRMVLETRRSINRLGATTGGFVALSSSGFIGATDREASEREREEDPGVPVPTGRARGVWFGQIADAAALTCVANVAPNGPFLFPGEGVLFSTAGTSAVAPVMVLATAGRARGGESDSLLTDYALMPRHNKILFRVLDRNSSELRSLSFEPLL